MDSSSAIVSACEICSCLTESSNDEVRALENVDHMLGLTSLSSSSKMRSTVHRRQFKVREQWLKEITTTTNLLKSEKKNAA